jgi:hypothetical protein
MGTGRTIIEDELVQDNAVERRIQRPEQLT